MLMGKKSWGFQAGSHTWGYLLLLIILMLPVGCADSVQDPVAVSLSTDDSGLSGSNSNSSQSPSSHYSWGTWTIFIDETHTRIDAVPCRVPQFHLNALRFSEEYCADCLKITHIVNNLDGTIDLTVSLKHPFEGFPQYTGFDVKGIIMFEGSYTLMNDDPEVPMPDPIRMSWRKLGDPEVLNPDGYTYYWSPSYESGSSLPMFNYWEGRFARGVPTADLNAFKNFYSLEERHIFETDKTVESTYTIWLPPGPIVAGYAIDASWAPPVRTPVTDPVNDFPLSANQPEYYHFEVVVNGGQPVTDCTECCEGFSCEDMYIVAENWGDPLYPLFYFINHNGFRHGIQGGFDCSPPIENCYPTVGFDSCVYENGWYRGYAYKRHFPPSGEDNSVMTFTIYDFVLDY